jgi:hypothetical protein
MGSLVAAGRRDGYHQRVLMGRRPPRGEVLMRARGDCPFAGDAASNEE